MHLLLIDDDPIAVFLTKRLLVREGFGGSITALLSSVEAMAFLQEAALTDTLPAVILLDINMPLLSGWDLLDELRPIEATLRDRCAVYILTSSLALADTARAKDYAFVTGLLHKPLTGLEIQTIRAQLQEK